LKYSADDTIDVNSLMANFVQHFSNDDNPTQQALYNYFNEYLHAYLKCNWFNTEQCPSYKYKQELELMHFNGIYDLLTIVY
ncbi:MAG: hypothetical protein Q8807_02870, partial ['Waltheria sp.' little leaf phytoplasma]|nr:hypothetical protein ['Waltheria sp.' little leaf phytoplasma]